MNVLVVPAIDWLAGPENRLHRIFHRISNQCHVHVVRFDMGEKPIRVDRLVHLHRPPTLKVSSLPLFYTLNALSQYRYFLKLIRCYKIDIVVTTNLLAGALAIKAAKREGIASVFDYVDYLPSFADNLKIQNQGKKLVSFVARMINDYNLYQCDLVIAAGELLYRHASKLHDHVVYLPNGVNIQRFNPNHRAEEIRNKYGLTGPVVGYVGYIQFWVNLEPVIFGFKEVLERFPDAKFLIVGPGKKLDSVKKLIHNLGLQSSVIVTGRIDYDLVPKYLSIMDVCILPFRKTSTTNCAIPLKAHEYAAMAKPIISTPLTELMREYEGAVISAESPQSFKNALLKIFGDAALRRKMGRKARDIAERKFSWDVIAQQYLKCLEITVNAS